MTSFKRWLVGDPISTERAHHERLNKKTALAVFSSDALSSVAYSTEAILLVLLAAGTIAISYLLPIALSLVFLLGLLTLSYRQTIHAYPSGGGAYIVAKDNLGTMPGLVAAASLLVDYILTVAVSISAGVAAITSATHGTRFAFLEEHRVVVGVGLIAIIAWINLRGVRESGAIFAGPTYLFILSMLALVAFGFVRLYSTGEAMPTPGSDELHFDRTLGTAPHELLTGGALVWLLLRAFAAGCTALTGVEAISNGVQAFENPEARNAAVTLSCMAAIMTTLILGTGLLAYKLNAHPLPGQTLVSAMARHTFGSGIIYYGVQSSTAAILVLAANTAFADFPRLSSLLSADRFLPRQLANRGDRLVFSNGILILAGFASALVIFFKGEEQAMLPLYALGVFLSFTLSQAGLVVTWLRERRVEDAKRAIVQDEKRKHRLPLALDPTEADHEQERLEALERDRSGHWFVSILINSTGAVITFAVLIVITLTKFTHGAWAVVALIPLIVVMFQAIHGHYRLVAAQLSLDHARPLPSLQNRLIIPVSSVHRGVLPALQYAQSLVGHGSAHATAVYVEVNPQHTREMIEEWKIWGNGIPLKVIQSPYRSLIDPLMDFIDREAEQHKDSIITVVLPEFVPRAWWQHLLHNQSALMLKGRLLFRPSIVVTSVPHHLRR